MKKILITFIILIVSFQLYSQHSIGAKYSYAQSELSVQTIYSAQYQTLFTLKNYGLVYRNLHETKFSNFKVGTQFELLMAEKGFRNSLNEDNGYKRTYKSLELPMVSQFMFTKGIFGISFNVGAHFGYFLSATELINTYNVEETYSYVFIYGADNRFEYGIDGGASLYLNFDFGSIQFNGRYAFGLSNIINKDIENVSRISTLNVLTVSAVYLHNLNFKTK